MKLNTKIFLPVLLGIFTACDSPDEVRTDHQRPNVVLIFADDLGYGRLSCYGHPTIQTPRLDRLAGEGIKLTSFYTAAAVCTPSRAGLLTGRYPLRVGLPGNLGPDSEGGLDREERTLAEALRANGYRTAAFGKWHLGAVPGYLPTDRGFDEYFGILYSNDMMPPWVNTRRPLHLYRNDQPTAELPVDQATLTQRYTDEAIRFLNVESDKPFFIYLPYAMPHLPLNASTGFRQIRRRTIRRRDRRDRRQRWQAAGRPRKRGPDGEHPLRVHQRQRPLAEPTRPDDQFQAR